VSRRDVKQISTSRSRGVGVGREHTEQIFTSALGECEMWSALL